MRYLLVLCVLLGGCGETTIAELKLKREEMQNISEISWAKEYAAEMREDSKAQAEHRAKKEAALLRIKVLDREIEDAANR